MSGEGEPSPSTSPMENSERSSSKKQRVLSPPPGFRVKKEVPDGEEVQEEQASGGGRAPMAVDPAAAARAEVVLRMHKDMLHCPLCTLPLKPPIFQCGVGHLACGSCHSQLSSNQCHSCDGDGDGGGRYARCPAMDAFVAKAVVPCPHQAHGCRASVAYYQATDHGTTCPHAPCDCGEPGCAFVGSPASLAAAPHSWPVDEVRYGDTLRLRVPEPESRRLLVAEEEGDGRRVFVLAVGDRGARAVPVTVACVRARGAAAVVGPQYTCKMWVTGGKAPATGKVESVLLDMEVPSAVAAGAVAADDEEATFLGLPRKMLRGASRLMFLSLRIDRVSG